MRLLIVSNRLPMTVERVEGSIVIKESSGGLVSGLSAYLDSMRGPFISRSEYIWIGWPGMADDSKSREEVTSRIYKDYNAWPVFMSAKAMDSFYLGFCNRTIWPLFHYFPSFAVFDDGYWDCYREVNERFRDAVLEIARPDDIIWVHDYHLMLLPALLRAALPDASIGFFLHIPFPSFELFRLLPGRWRREILEGMLGADLIGFHTHEYTQYFLRCVLRILGREQDMGSISSPDRVIRVDTFPMGIEYKKFSEAASAPDVLSERNRLRSDLGDSRIILSVDRLDYSKGILNRLRAFDLYLSRNPSAMGKVMLVLLVVPSRIGVIDYQRIKSRIDEQVGRINGAYGSITWTPVRYLYRHETFRPLVALYAASDVCLVTPLRDGMNLVAKEYIASRTDRTGVLILSEMAGAAKELGEAVLVNPNDISELADALAQALDMPVEEQVRRNRIMQERLSRYDVVRWADDFIEKLGEASQGRRNLEIRYLGPASRERLLGDYRSAKRRLLMLDYDGTLVPFSIRPGDARPDEEVMDILSALCADERNHAMIVSGRDKNTLDRWFDRLPIGLVAEHGVWMREPGMEWQAVSWVTAEWKSRILPLLEMFADRLPGAFVEEKEFSLAWHYRGSDSEQASLRAKELLDDLVNFTANINLQIIHGHKAIEVRNAGISKGNAGARFISEGSFDFLFAAGDDRTDEDMFRSFPEDSYTIKVGPGQSHARFTIPDFTGVRALLREMTA